MPRDKLYRWSLIGAIAFGAVAFHFFLQNGVRDDAFRQAFAAFALFVIATAFLVQTGVAVGVGTAASFLPEQLVRAAAAVMFVVGAVVLYRAARTADADPLSEANNALRSLIQASPLAVIALDPELNVTMWNAAAEVLRDQVSDAVWMSTFAEVVPDEMPGGLLLSVPNRWTKERIEERHLDAVRGALSDIAPTLLRIMGLPQPPEMTGNPLIDFG